MKKYSAYNPSKIDWIGEIPSTWSVIPFKRLTQVKRGASPRPIDDQKYFDENGEYGWVRIADVTASERYLQHTTQKLSELGASLSVKRHPGDLFLSIAGTVGKPIISKIKCCIHDGFVWFPDLKIDPEFLYYIFSAGLAYQGLGKMGTQLNLNTDTVGYINLPLPSEEEICQIVRYLDRNTAKIDSLISNKQKLIDLLKEERTSIINQAVTKGLNPDTEMKDSGIEWLGQIPKHWEVKRLKYLTNGMIAGPFGSSLTKDMYTTEGYRVYGQEQVIPADFTIGDYYISKEIYNLMNHYAVAPGDVLISCVGTFGKVAVVPKEAEPGIINPRLVKLTPKLSVTIPIYLGMFLKSRPAFDQMEQVSRGGTMGVINLGLLSDLQLPLPPLSEQQSIIVYLDHETAKIDLTKGKIQKELDLLQEYRTALISEVVTGKIDVREEVGSWT